MRSSAAEIAPPAAPAAPASPVARDLWAQIVDRQTGLLTPAQNEIVRGCRLLMLGLGGMGMNAAALLARAGFQRFTLVDCDEVDGTSANRLPFAFDDTLGSQKVEAARKYLLKINPRAEVAVHPRVRLGLDSDPEFTARLMESHDVQSWAMDGLAGRIHYTRLAHRLGQRSPSGRPAVESWAVPYHLCVWTVPNAPGTPTWEELFRLPTAAESPEAITPAALKETQRFFFAGFLRRLPGIEEAIGRELLERWLGLSMPNRTLGCHVAGCGALVAYEILKNALVLGGEPLRHAEVRSAPWMALYDARRNAAYEHNFATGQFRWRHPLTGRLVVEDRREGFSARGGGGTNSCHPAAGRMV